MLIWLQLPDSSEWTRVLSSFVVTPLCYFWFDWQIDPSSGALQLKWFASMIAIGRYGGGNNIVDRVETVYPYARGYSILGLPKILCLPKILGLLLSFFKQYPAEHKICQHKRPPVTGNVFWFLIENKELRHSKTSSRATPNDDYENAAAGVCLPPHVPHYVMRGSS